MGRSIFLEEESARPRGGLPMELLEPSVQLLVVRARLGTAATLVGVLFLSEAHL